MILINKKKAYNFKVIVTYDGSIKTFTDVVAFGRADKDNYILHTKEDHYLFSTECSTKIEITI
jgi:hypothetical protein